jgi:hypothetical protein
MAGIQEDPMFICDMEARQWMNMKTSQEPPAQLSHQWGALHTLLDKGGGSQTLPTPSGYIYVCTSQ